MRAQQNAVLKITNFSLVLIFKHRVVHERSCNVWFLT